MSRESRIVAIRGRRRLILELGGVCVQCGTDKNLVIDHTHGRDWDLRKYDNSMRLARYRREARENLIQVLCVKCNVTKGRDQITPRIKIEEQVTDALPF